MDSFAVVECQSETTDEETYVPDTGKYLYRLYIML